MTSIFNIFAKSPIKPLQQHISTCFECAKLLCSFFNAVTQNDWQQAASVYDEIRDLEHQADELKQKLRLNLPQSLFLPVSRADLIQMIKVQDKIANRAKDISGLTLGRKMAMPEAIAEFYMSYLKASLRTVGKAKKAIHELDELLETGFRGVEVKVVEKMIIELDDCEHETDELQVTIRRKLFEIEDSLSPVDVMFLYKVIEWTGDLSDDAQIIGGQLQLLLAR